MSTPERHSWRPVKHRKLFTANHFLSAQAQRLCNRPKRRNLSGTDRLTTNNPSSPDSCQRRSPVLADADPGLPRVVKPVIAMHTMHSIFATRTVDSTQIGHAQ